MPTETNEPHVIEYRTGNGVYRLISFSDNTALVRAALDPLYVTPEPKLVELTGGEVSFRSKDKQPRELRGRRVVIRKRSCKE